MSLCLARGLLADGQWALNGPMRKFFPVAVFVFLAAVALAG